MQRHTTPNVNTFVTATKPLDVRAVITHDAARQRSNDTRLADLHAQVTALRESLEAPLATADLSAALLEGICLAAEGIAPDVDMPNVPTGTAAFGHISSIAEILSPSLVGSIKHVTETMPILSLSDCRQVQEACEAILQTWPNQLRTNHANELKAMQGIKRALRHSEAACAHLVASYAAAMNAVEDATQRLQLVLQVSQPWEYDLVERCARRARAVQKARAEQ